MGETEEEAKNDAREKAVLMAAGTQVTSALSIFEGIGISDEPIKMRQRSLLALTNGLAIDESIVERKWDLPEAGSGRKPILVVKMKVNVLDLGVHDEFYKVNIGLIPSREEYIDNMDVRISVTANDTSYITLVAQSVEGKIYVLVPNPEYPAGYLQPGEIKELDTKMMIPDGYDVAPEQLIVVATRGRPGFLTTSDLNNWNVEGTEGSEYYITNQVGTIDKFAEWLCGLPANQWAMNRVQYRIVK